MTESENGALIRKARGACIELDEFTKQGRIMKYLFHGLITQAKTLLHNLRLGSLLVTNANHLETKVVCIMKM